MQATIERERTRVTPRRRVHGIPVNEPSAETPSFYKAPLATFLVLVASARASACSADESEATATKACAGARV